MKRRATFLALPLIAGAALFGGCGSGDEGGIDPTGDSSVSETEESEYLEPGGIQSGGTTGGSENQEKLDPTVPRGGPETSGEDG
jgi:hypothetical protein